MTATLGYYETVPRIRTLVDQALNSGRLSYGPLSRQFEAMWAKLHGCSQGVFVNSGTSALHLTLQALKTMRHWPDAAEVIVPATTFVATYNAVVHNRLKPVVVDVDPWHFGMTLESFRKSITKNTVAVVPVHILGRPCDIGRIASEARDRGIAVVEDSCEAVGSRLCGKVVGSFGDAACFSTYAAHPVVTGVGGMVTTNDPDLALTVRSLANHGRDPSYLSIDDPCDPSLRFKFVEQGHSFRATELEAAIGIPQLEGWEDTAMARRSKAYALWNKLPKRLSSVPFMDFDGSLGVWTVPMNYPLLCRDAEEKRRFVTALEDAGVQTRDLVTLVGQPCYGGGDFNCPVSADLARKALYIGCHQGMTEDDLIRIAKTAREAIACPT